MVELNTDRKLPDIELLEDEFVKILLNHSLLNVLINQCSITLPGSYGRGIGSGRGIASDVPGGGFRDHCAGREQPGTAQRIGAPVQSTPDVDLYGRCHVAGVFCHGVSGRCDLSCITGTGMQYTGNDC